MERLLTLGAATDVAAIAEPFSKAPSQLAELLGASAGPVAVSNVTTTSVPVALHPGVKAEVNKSLK